MSSKFHELATALFEGKVRAADIKTMPGTSTATNREQLSGALLASMQRMGIVCDKVLVDKSNQS